ncbi:MAG: hypothetical protein HN981_03615 [Candidatus Pacebacteria bacterium]|jgi:hypothetical protein|nr:hypothetical protein [Candidatus Paceibacterota bacterium]MBT4652285.1 hypothetical protein [Candidatus Paceibacterota bacterium]MBT6756478.1 hypothetical protein [Candidatus Paceibacterota bacterium]MBT6921451.1 hypothetical protein [Candidatus Paceibacterota bacterium]
MKKQLKIIPLIITLILIIAGSSWAGWLVAENKNSIEKEPSVEKETKQQADIYFYRTDGIYKISNKNTTPEKIVEMDFDSEKHYYFNSKYNFMGFDHNWLVYRDAAGENKMMGTEFGLMVFDMENKKEVWSVKEDNASVLSFLVSPSGSKLAYVISHYDPNEKQDVGPQKIAQELYVWDGESEPELIISEENHFGSLVMGIWIDEENLTVGRGYEGVSLCAININTDSEIPDDCQGYGASHMGLTDTIKESVENKLYGHRYEWTEVTGSKKATQGIFEQEINGERKYLTNDAPSDMVVTDKNIYYLRNSQNASKYTWNGVETDLYMVSKTGELIKRLTNDGTSFMAKSNLSLSNNNKFISYQIMDTSKISPNKNTLKEQTENSSIWLYDIETNKYYKIADKGLSPKVIIKNLD